MLRLSVSVPHWQLSLLVSARFDREGRSLQYLEIYFLHLGDQEEKSFVVLYVSPNIQALPCAFSV